jgi:hypothetical protein
LAERRILPGLECGRSLFALVAFFHPASVLNEILLLLANFSFERNFITFFIEIADSDSPAVAALCDITTSLCCITIWIILQLFRMHAFYSHDTRCCFPAEGSAKMGIAEAGSVIVPTLSNKHPRALKSLKVLCCFRSSSITQWQYLLAASVQTGL